MALPRVTKLECGFKVNYIVRDKGSQHPVHNLEIVHEVGE
jgi:hypothetical protein